jgi:S1-C subfamily serine protease
VQTASLRVVLPPDDARNETTISGPNPMQGARVANITPALADEKQMDLMASGVIVIAIADGSAAKRFGFEQGDVIRQINGARIGTVAELRRALDATDGWQIALQRGSRLLNLAVR